MQWAIVVFGALSALFWFGAALTTPDLSKSYWGGPPIDIKNRAKIGSWLNGFGALFASLAIACQAWQTYISI